MQIGGFVIGAVVNAAVNYNDYRSGKISGGDYAKLIGVGGVSGLISTLGGGIASGAVLGGIGSATNNIATQKIKNKCGESINAGEAGRAFALGVGAGGIAGLGSKIGQQIIQIPDELIVGQPLMDYGVHGGLIGNLFGTVYTNQER